MIAKLYLIGSLRNPGIPELGHFLRQSGFDVFDHWWCASEDADDTWKTYAQARGQTYREALYDHAATHVYEFDKAHLDTSHMGVLAMPAGKSGWAEMGLLRGQGKPVYIYFEEEPAVDRWDVMARIASGICYTRDELLSALTEEVKKTW